MAQGSYADELRIADEHAQAALLSEAQASSSSSLVSLQTTFPLYVHAAQSYSQLLSNPTLPPAQRPSIIKRWKMVLDRADKLKRAIESRGGAVGKIAAEDQSRSMEIRRRGSVVNGVHLADWDERGLNRRLPNEWLDPHPPTLSHAQMELSPVWKRVQWSTRTGKEKELDNDSALEVEQGPGADCSVVAALAVCIGHHRRHKSFLGHHIVKFIINGIPRSVEIDDRLPYDNAGKALHAVARVAGDDAPWVGLLEKAYMKVMGGYDFPGSNPSADLYAITGWLPDRIVIKDSAFQREKTWKRLKTGHDAGICLITLGTGKDAGQGLVPLHAYGVLDAREQDGQRLLQIVNPWRRGHRASHGNSTEARLAELHVNESEYMPQVFCLSWDAVCTKFETVELNWKPLPGLKTADVHWCWRKPLPTSSTDSALSFTQNPRYRLSATTTEPGSEIWILLSQHITHKDRKGDAIALHIFEGDTVGSVLAPSRATYSGSYTDGLHVLVRYRLLRKVNELLVVPARDGGTFETGFSLHAFSVGPIKLERIVRNLQYSEEIVGSITTRSAGGNPAHPTHMNNPQYRLELKSAKTDSLPDRGSVRVSLQGSKSCAWNVKLVFGAGERMEDIVEGDVLLDSGSYTFSMAVAESSSLQSGVYTLIVSLFEPGWTGDFNLLVESSLPLSITAIPQEGAGMYHRSMIGSWSDATAGGHPGGGGYDINPKIEMTVAQPCSAFARLFLPTPSGIPINATVFKRGNGGSLGEQVATSGPYSEQTSGVKVPRTKLEPGIYIIVPSAYQRGMRADWSLNVWSDRPVELERIHGING